MERGPKKEQEPRSEDETQEYSELTQEYQLFIAGQAVLLKDDDRARIWTVVDYEKDTKGDYIMAEGRRSLLLRDASGAETRAHEDDVEPITLNPSIEESSKFERLIGKEVILDVGDRWKIIAVDSSPEEGPDGSTVTLMNEKIGSGSIMTLKQFSHALVKVIEEK